MSEGLIDGQVYQYQNTEGQDIKFFKEGSFVYFDTDGDVNDLVPVDVVLKYSNLTDYDRDGSSDLRELQTLLSGGNSDPLRNETGKISGLAVNDSSLLTNNEDSKDNEKCPAPDYDDFLASVNLSLSRNDLNLYSVEKMLEVYHKDGSLGGNDYDFFMKDLKIFSPVVFEEENQFLNDVQNLNPGADNILVCTTCLENPSEGGKKERPEEVIPTQRYIPRDRLPIAE